MATYDTILQEYFLTTQLAKCLCVCVAKCMRLNNQNLSLQKDALLKYGVDERNIFSDKTSGSKDERVGLDKALEFLKDGDTLVVWKLDRLGRSLAHLISVITD